MTKKLLLIGLMLTLIITLNGCYSDDPKPNEKAAEVPISSFSESEETIDSESATEVATEETDVITQEETEYSKDIAETDTTTVSATKETPKSNGTEKDNKPDSAKQPTEQPKSETKTPENQTQPVTQEPAEKTEPTEPEKKVETVPNATKDDCKVIAQRVLEYINSYRGTPATKLSGLTGYAEYRSRQLVGNFSHSTDDERAAATALCYGEYVDPALYGMTGEPYYTAGAREAIVKTGYVGSIDKVAEKIALLVKNSSGHWNYVGSSDYSYIAENNASIYINKELQRCNKDAMEVLDNKDIIQVFPHILNANTTSLVLKAPKTPMSVRKVFLPTTVANMLVERKQQIDDMKVLYGDEYKDYNLVFCHASGRPMEGQVINRALKQLIRDNDLPDIVFHSFRHASITYKLKWNGGDMKSVQGDSGHARMDMISNVYSHIIDEDRRFNAQRFEEQFYNAKGLKNVEGSPADTVPTFDAVEVLKPVEKVEPSKEETPKEDDAALIAKLLSNPDAKALLKALASSL